MRNEFICEISDQHLSAETIPFWVESVTSRVCLHFPRFQQPCSPLDLSLQDWVEEVVQWKVIVEVVKEEILSGIATFTVDGSFFRKFSSCNSPLETISN